MRGFLTHFGQLVATGHAFDRCTACCGTVLDAFAAPEGDGGGFGFLLRAFNEPDFLEELTGLAQMAREADEAQWDVDLDDSDEEWA